jgi:uncharacterized lipoprotein YajG
MLKKMQNRLRSIKKLVVILSAALFNGCTEYPQGNENSLTVPITITLYH